MTFKEYYALHESPMRISSMDREELDLLGINVEDAKEIVDTTEPIATVNRESLVFNLFVGPRDGFHYWITPTPFIACYFSFEEKDGGIQFRSAWNHVSFQSSARFLVFEYYLKKYEFVQSDQSHSPRGEAYWKKLAATALSKDHLVVVYDSDDKVEEVYNPSWNYWDNDGSYARYTLKIYR